MNLSLEGKNAIICGSSQGIGYAIAEELVFVKDIVKQLPPIMDRFYSNEELRTCKKCGSVLQPPVRKG